MRPTLVYVATTGRTQVARCVNKMSTAAFNLNDAERAFDPTESGGQSIWHATAAHQELQAHTLQSAMHCFLGKSITRNYTGALRLCTATNSCMTANNRHVPKRHSWSRQPTWRLQTAPQMAPQQQHLVPSCPLSCELSFCCT